MNGVTRFLSFPAIIILVFLLALTACEEKPKKHALKVRKVFVIADPIDSTELLRKRFLELNRDSSYIEYIFRGYKLVNIKSMDSSIRIQLRYADTNNFLGKNIYDGLRQAYFTCETAIKVCAAQFYLKQINPDLSLVILDASRPQHIQKVMWDSLNMNPHKKFNYLSHPDETSMHNYGCAIDATIFDTRRNVYLDMGTEYDYFHKLSQPIYEYHFLKSGELSREAFDNRRLLRTVLKKAKMNPINSEWWHFSSMTKEEAIKTFPLIK